MTTTTHRLIGQPAPTGMLNVRILDQTDIWQDAHGNVYTLADMDTSHLQNLEPFLTKHGENLRSLWLWALTQEKGRAVPTVINTIDGRNIYGPPTDWMPDSFDAMLDYEESRPFAEWLADRPLITQIRQIIAERPDRNGPTFDIEVPF